MLEKKMLKQLEQYVNDHLELIVIEASYNTSDSIDSEILYDLHSSELEEYIDLNKKPTLQQVLFAFIDQRNLLDTEVYKKARIDRKHFSKIRSNQNYHPKKNTIIALALALELSKDDTEKLLSSAGFTLTESNTSDLVIQFCLEKKIYDIDSVNEALEYFSLKPLIG
ncbi:hypothetical protein ACERII_14540 [Evansella sp. AB-rgal1]|uniref:hypothetical protein n=1 Tax=Evansella sp. AB-rgal1 TaxID=3242696 RepID=UPI00359D0DB4